MARKKKDLSITISPEENTPIKHVAFIMNIAMKYEIGAIWLLRSNRFINAV